LYTSRVKGTPRAYLQYLLEVRKLSQRKSSSSSLLPSTSFKGDGAFRFDIMDLIEEAVCPFKTILIFRQHGTLVYETTCDSVGIEEVGPSNRRSHMAHCQSNQK